MYVGVRLELYELPIGSNLTRIQGLFCAGVQGLYKLLRVNNLPRILEEFEQKIRRESCKTLLLLSYGRQMRGIWELIKISAFVYNVI